MFSGVAGNEYFAAENRHPYRLVSHRRMCVYSLYIANEIRKKVIDMKRKLSVSRNIASLVLLWRWTRRWHGSRGEWIQQQSVNWSANRSSSTMFLVERLAFLSSLSFSMNGDGHPSVHKSAKRFSPPRDHPLLLDYKSPQNSPYLHHNQKIRIFLLPCFFLLSDFINRCFII